MEIAIAGNNYRLIAIIPLNHCVQNQFRVNISFYFHRPVFFDFQCWFKNANITGFLQKSVKQLIIVDISNVKRVRPF